MKLLRLILFDAILTVTFVCGAFAQESVWRELNDQIASLYRRGCYLEAIPIAEKALSVAESSFGLEDVLTATSLNNLAALYFAQGRYADAEPTYKRALAITEKALGANNAVVGTHVYNLAELYWAQGCYADAEALYKRALRIRVEALGPENPDVAASLSGLGRLYRTQGRYADAEPLYRRALNIRVKTLGPEHRDVAASLDNLALLYGSQGRYADAELLHRQAIAIYERALGTGHPDAAKSMNDLADLFKAQGRYADAEPLYNRALVIYEKGLGPEHPNVASVLNNLAGLHQAQGRYAEAESLYYRAFRIYEKVLGPRHAYFARFLNNLALLYATQGHYTDAEWLFHQAIGVSEKALGAEHPDVAMSSNNLAELYFDQGRYTDAEVLLKKALAIREKALGLEHPDFAGSLNNLAALYYAQGLPAKSEPLYKRALGILEKGFGYEHPNVAAALNNLALVYKDQGKYADAERLFLRSLGVFSKGIVVNFPSLSEKEKSQFYATVQLNFEAFNSFVLVRKQQNPSILTAVLNNQIATKALLLDATSKVNRLIRKSGDTMLVRQFNQWRTTREYLAKALALTKNEQQTRGIQVDSLERAANEMEKELSRQSEGFKKEFERKPITWEQVRSALQTQEAGVEIVRFRSHNKRWTDTVYYAALIVTQATKAHPEIVVLENGNQLEGEFAKLYRSVMAIGRDTTTRGARLEAVETLPIDEGRLYAAYWQQIRKALGGIKRVYLSVDGVYNNINVETLKMPDGRYVSEVLEIRSVTSLRYLVAQHEPAKSGNVAELFGYPKYDLGAKEQLQLAANAKGEFLPQAAPYVVRGSLRGDGVKMLQGTEKEIKQIDNLLRDSGLRTEVHLQEGALEEEVKRVDNPRVLHIATHGFFQPDMERTKDQMLQMNESRPVQNPLLRSGVLLAGAERTLNRKEGEQINTEVDDGILTAYEAMNMNLDQTELVVLSACETGLGEVRNGEGVYGLQRAFQVAGARYVLMSLWKVDDTATQELMTAFYKEWLRTGDVRTGFKEAQRQIREKYHNPFYWGAFVLVGV